MEAVTAFAEGPCCFAVVYGILTRQPWRYTLMMLVSLGQIYGDVLYFATCLIEGMLDASMHGSVRVAREETPTHRCCARASRAAVLLVLLYHRQWDMDCGAIPMHTACCRASEPSHCQGKEGVAERRAERSSIFFICLQHVERIFLGFRYCKFHQHGRWVRWVFAAATS